MQRFILALLMLAGMAGSQANAAASLFIFEGDLFITAATSQCTANGFSVDQFGRAVLRPADIGGNGKTTSLGIIYQRAAVAFELVNKKLGNGTWKGQGVNSTAVLATWNSAFTGVVAAPALKATSTEVTLVATIATFGGVTGCKVTVKGTLTLRPGL